MGIEKFIARRGTPQVLWSDNGTNLTGAENELSACFKALNQRKIASKMSQKGISGTSTLHLPLIMVLRGNAWYGVSNGHSTLFTVTAD